MNGNELYAVEEDKFDNPLNTEKDSIKHKCFRVCHNNYFHNFIYECIYDNILKNSTSTENVNLTISGKSMNLYELNRKLTVAGKNGLIFSQINKLIIKFYSHSRFINISSYLKSQIPMCHRQFFRVIPQNRKYVDIFCSDRNNPFHYASQKWIKKCM